MSASLRALVAAVSRRGDAPPAFVLGTGCNGISFLKSLGRRGIPVVAIDSWMQAGMYSRYCVPIVAPDPIEQEEELLDRIMEIGGELPRRGVLLTTTDASALLVSKHRGRLSEHFDFTVSDHETIRRLTSKRAQIELAREMGVPTPISLFPDKEGVEAVAREIPYPCIIKPSNSHLWSLFLRDHGRPGWGKLREARSPSELVSVYNEMRESGLEFVVQEKIGGGDDQLYGLLTYLDRSSTPLGVFTKRKIRQYPRGYGNGSLQVGIWDPDVADLGLRLLRELDYQGIAGVEFKRDPADGRLKLIEINPRSISQTYHAVVSGVDIPYIAYRDAMGADVRKALSFREGIIWVSLERDLKAFLEYHRNGDLELGEWLRSWRGERCYAYFSMDDPLPACAALWQFLRAEIRSWRSTHTS